MRSSFLVAVGITAPAVLLGQDQQKPADDPASAGAIWRTVGDTTLERLIDEALRGNHDLRVANARIRGARAARLSAALDLTPAVSVSGGHTRQRLATSMVPGATGTLPTQGQWDAGLRLSWELDVFGGGRRSLQGQGALLSAASEDLRDVQVLLVAEVADAYFALRGAQDRLVVAERSAANLRRTLELTLQRLEGGSGTALDSERAQALLSATLAGVPLLEAAIADARYRIGVLTARDPADIDAASYLGGRAPAIELPDEVVLGKEQVDTIVRRRPDVLSTERQVAAQTAFVGAARANYYPRFAIGAGAGYSASRFETLGDDGSPRFSIGPVVSWPAFDLPRVKAGVDAARAGEAEATARHQQAALRARAEIESSLIAYQRARVRLRHLEESAAASERAAELARLRFSEGASDFLPVLDAERTLLEAQNQRVLGRSQATAALVAVDRALGGAWPRGPSR